MSMHPQKFALWLFMISIGMTFAALTSAYIVKSGEGPWLEFEMPGQFWYSTIVILLSSITIQAAYFLAKKDSLAAVKALLAITFLLGLGFLATQWMAWKQLVANEVYFVGNPSGSFIYVLSGVHGFHIIAALIFVLATLISAFRYKIHSKKMTKLEMCVTFWHFLGAVWVYLFVFMMMDR